jgi:hypothetical protein
MLKRAKGIWLVGPLALCSAEALSLRPAPSQPAILYVDDDAPPGGNGRNWRHAIRHLQDALDLAERSRAHVREIRVAQGVYKPDQGLWVEPLDQDATFFLIDGVAVRGGYRGHYAGPGNPHQRDIDAFTTYLSGDLLGDGIDYDDNSFHIVTAMYVGPETELEGFEIREATDNPDALPPEPTSGAFLAFGGKPLIQRCTFADNRGHNDSASMVLNDSNAVVRTCLFWFNLSNGNSPAIAIRFGHPIVEDCRFLNNVAFYETGGAMSAAASAAEIRRCLFLDNSAGNQGGATYIGASPLAVVEDCLYFSNSAGWEGGGHWGGGTLKRCLFVSNHASVEGGGMRGSGTTIDCAFIGNETSSRGGSAIKGGGTRINCLFMDNFAASQTNGGGAIWADFDSTLINCVFTGNRSFGPASAIYVDSGRIVTAHNCTIANNIATGSQSQAVVGEAMLSNCIVWGNSGGSIGPLVEAAFSCIENGPTGAGNIAIDPKFVDPLGGDGVPGTKDDDLRLSSGSPCIDRGDNQLLPADLFDLDGDGDLSEAVPVDFAYNPRIVSNGHGRFRVGMGAFEFVGFDGITSLRPVDLTP